MAIPDGIWTPVATLQDFQGQRQLVSNVDGMELLLLRIGVDVAVLLNSCTHMGKSLAGGRVMGGQITCPFHGACFDVRSGAPLSGPAVRPAHVFPARLEGETVLADLTRKPIKSATGIDIRGAT